MGSKAKRSKEGTGVVSVAGRGAYHIQEATRLLRLNKSVRELVSAPSVRRWAYGYMRRGTKYDAAIRSDDFSRTTGTLSFLELVEIMFIASWLASGAKWSKVREAARVAAHLLPNEPHPFAQRKWFADPAGVYLKLGISADEEILIEMAGHAQIAMEELLSIYLKQIRFNEYTGLADAWYPMGHDFPVVLDPLHAFGLPTVTTGVRTDVLAEQHWAGDSIETIAAWYAVPDHEVRAAVRFENLLLPTAA